MKAVYLEGPRRIVSKEVERPSPSEDEVLVKIRVVGVCGSDIHYYQNGRIGDFVVKKPLIFGHESAGVVFEVGPGVTRFRPGDRVAVEPGYTRRQCHYCKTGRSLSAPSTGGKIRSSR